MIINKTENSYLDKLIEKVLRKTSNKKEHGLDKDISIVDYDLDRVYLECNNKEFSLRTWNIVDEGEKTKVQWTLFVMIYEENGDGHGEELSFGVSVI